MSSELVGFQRPGQGVNGMHEHKVGGPQAGRCQAHDSKPVGGFAEEIVRQGLAAARSYAGRRTADIRQQDSRVIRRYALVGSHD
jgi:hypothetical protein